MNKQIRLTAICLTAALITCAAVLTVPAQVATGGSYSLDQAVIASGGGQNSAGGNFTLDGAIGQAITGTSSASPLRVNGGFFTPDFLQPTAANVTIEGRIQTGNGAGIRNVLVILAESDGTIRTAKSGTFGTYRFSGVTVGQVVILSVRAKKYNFAQPTRVLSLTGDVTELDFTASEQ